VSSAAEGATPGLRERKKAKTRDAIQHHAIRLFRKQGYAATTIEQIVAAAEVSESTFFRYFPTKEAVVLTDNFDPLIIAAFRDQPANISVVGAMRRAIRSVFETLSADEIADLRDRSVMILEVPELWGAALVQLTDGMQMMAELAAERLGRPADDPRVRDLAAATTGLMIGQLRTWAEQPDIDIVESIDDSLAFLEAGLRIRRS
jgi:AcrR family transcriptional regulator